MKKLSIFLALAMALTLCGCTGLSTDESPAIVTANNSKNVISTVFSIGYIDRDGLHGLQTYVCGTLVVDRTTTIVYLDLNNNAGFTPYLAPNGQPYTYNAENSTLVPLPSYQGEEFPEEWIIPVGSQGQMPE